MRCKTKQRKGSRPDQDPRVSSHAVEIVAAVCDRRRKRPVQLQFFWKAASWLELARKTGAGR